MATPWRVTRTADENHNTHSCDNTPSTSSWPSTELALETPERNRWRYKRRSDTVHSTPPRPFNVFTSPKTPKMKRTRENSPSRHVPGKALLESSPSPLRRFKISQSCSSSYKTERNVGRLEYRISGPQTKPLTTIQLDYSSSSLDDSGISSLTNTSSNVDSLFTDCSWNYSSYDDSFSVDSFFCDTYQTNSSDYFSRPSTQLQTDSQTQMNAEVEHSFTPEEGHGIVRHQREQDNPKEAEEKVFSANVTRIDEPEPQTPACLEIKHQKLDTAIHNASRKGRKNAVGRVKQKTLEEKIYADLEKYNSMKFDEEFAAAVDMTEFRKLKLFSATTSSYYRVVLGRSKEQLEVTREAHRYLNSKRVRK